MLPNVKIVQTGHLVYALFDNHNDIVTRATLNGGFEPELHELSNNILKETKDGVVLDIGANLGSYTVPIAKNHPQLQFHSFEPQQTIFYQLCTNIFLNGLENVSAHHKCLSDYEWVKELEVPNYVLEQNIGAFSVDNNVRTDGYEVLTHGRTETISAIKLDTMNLKNIRLIKLDVEGHEMEVLLGAINTLKNNGYPPILFEAWNFKFAEKREKLFRFIKDLGYEISAVGHNSNYLAIRRG